MHKLHIVFSVKAKQPSWQPFISYRYLCQYLAVKNEISGFTSQTPCKNDQSVKYGPNTPKFNLCLDFK